jgi:hypothetical protein
METICINGIEFCNFGPNNLSCGMSLISLYPTPENLVQRVLDGEFPGVYLNPSARCDSEFYGVFGTAEQYKEFHKRQKNAQIASRVVDKFGFDLDVPKDVWQAYEQGLRDTYKDWWEK